MWKFIWVGLGIVLMQSIAWAQPYTLGQTLRTGYWYQVEPKSGFGFERINQTENRGIKCAVAFGGTIEIILILPNSVYGVQYTPTTNANGALNECQGTTAYFEMTEELLTQLDGWYNAIVANPPQ